MKQIKTIQKKTFYISSARRLLISPSFGEIFVVAKNREFDQVKFSCAAATEPEFATCNKIPG